MGSACAVAIGNVNLAWFGAPPTLMSCAGVRRVRPCHDDYVAPYNGVFIPQGVWTPRDLSQFGRSSGRPGDTIWHLPLPRAILTRVHAQLAGRLAEVQVSDYVRAFGPNDFDEAADAVVAEAGARLGRTLQWREPKLAVHFHHVLDLPPSSMAHASTTYSERGVEGLRGLHIDNWERPFPPLPERGRAGMKLLMNVGTVRRSFIFVPKLATELFDQGLDDDSLPFLKEFDLATRLSEWHLDRNPGAEVFRILVEPGDALICPVQNLIHDGYPRGMEAMDFCLQVRVFADDALAAAA